MKPVLNSILSVAFFLITVDLFSDEQKERLYFEGTKVIVSANLNSQPEFVEKADKTIDAELFASRILPFVGNAEKNLIKEKTSKCDKIECVLSEAAKNGISVFVRSEISFLPDSFKGTLKMYETESGYLIAEVSKIGSLEKPEQQYSAIVKDLVLESLYYFTFKGYSQSIDDFENFTVTPFNPVTDFAGMTLSAVQTGEYQESKIFPPEQMTEFHDLSKIKDRKLIALYEEALRADRLGESDPLKAAGAWKKVNETASAEIKDYALKRSNEWYFYNKEIKESESLKNNFGNEAEFQLFPEIIVKMWQDFLSLQPDLKRSETAKTRIELYSAKYDNVKKYLNERSNLFENAKQVHLRNAGAISDPKIAINRKISMFLTFMKKYGPVDDDFYLLDSLLNKLPSEKDKLTAAKNIYNKWNGMFFKSKCDNNEPQSCITADQIFRKIKDGSEAVNVQISGCKKGILELCASLAQTKLAAPEDPELQTLAEKSCAMGSGKGCAVLANFYNVAVTVKPKAKKELLYKAGCERGYQPACNGEVNLATSAAVIKKDNPEIVQQPEKKKEKAPSEPRKQSEFLKTHPYFWYGFSSMIAGVVLGAVSINYGVETDLKYSEYNDRIDNMLSKIEDFKALPYDEKIETMNYTKSVLSDGDKYKKIAIGTGIAGGVMIVTGIVLMAVKKPVENSVQLSFMPSSEGFMLGASFTY